MLKQNIFDLMEAENWNTISDRLRRLLIRLSLIDLLPAELIKTLTAGDDELFSELRNQNAYIRFESYSGVYLIHHLFLDFLRAKQGTLTDDEKHKTYKTAAHWCRQNNFTIDALGYYEKVGDYEEIASIIIEMPPILMINVASRLKGIFDRTPKEIFDRVDMFAPAHLRTLLSMDTVQEAVELMEYYEKKFNTLPENDIFRKRTMGAIYHIWGKARIMMSIEDGRYDYDQYFAQAVNCLGSSPLAPIRNCRIVGPWISLVSSIKQEAMHEYIESMIRSVSYVRQFFNDWMAGEDDLAQGELLFYQGEPTAAQTYITRALEHARKSKQHDIIHRSLFYTMRIAVLQGNLAKAEQAFKDIETQLDEKEYYDRFFTYDISIGWYHYILRKPESIPDWLKGSFSHFFSPILHENFGNQMKIRHHYLIRNFPPILAYIEERKQKTEILFGRIEMLAIEACIHYQMKNKELAFNTLREAYELAAPNKIIMPFIELGRDMRTLITTALQEQPDGTVRELNIPRLWLESVKNKATAYAKNQSMHISEYNKNNGGNNVLSAREHDVLNELYNGLSQSEIASKRNLSIHTVKMVTKNIYEKLYVHKMSDLIRVTAEQGLL